MPDILRLTGLSTKLHNYPDQLSGGEQQRVAIARAFVNHPPLLIADEPTGNLDPETSIGIMQLLYRINQTGTTVAGRHPRRGDGGQDAPPRDRARRRAKIVRDEQAGGYARASETTREFAIRMRSAEARVRLVFFLREALRALKRNAIPSFAAMATVLVTVLVLGVFIPVVQATTGAANEVREQGDRRRLPQGRRQEGATSTASGALLEAEPLVGKRRVHLQGAGATRPRRKRNPKAYELLGSNPLPDTFRVTPDKPDDIGKLKDALAPAAPGGGRRSSTPRSTRSATARRTPTRSSRSRAS